jgi:hypothetical protein
VLVGGAVAVAVVILALVMLRRRGPKTEEE